MVVDEGTASSLDSALSKRIDELWASESKRRGEKLTNGSLLVFNRAIGQDKLGARFVEYKQYLAQRLDADVKRALKLEPLAVSGVLVVEDQVLVAKRAPTVSAYPGCYELVPSGGITRAHRLADATIDYRGQTLEELAEEASIIADRVSQLNPFVLVFDDHDKCYDIGMEIRLNCSLSEAKSLLRENAEYGSFSFLKRADAASFLSKYEGGVVPTSLALLEALK